MHRLKQLSVGKQVLLAFGTLCVIFLIIGGLFFFSLRSIERGNQLQQSRALNKLALIDDTAQDVGQMQAEVLRQVLASDPGETKRLDQAIHDIEKTNAGELADYKKSADTEKEGQLYDRVMRAQKAYWQQTQLVMAASRANQGAEATKFINSRQAPAYDEFLKAVNGLIDYVETDAKETSEATTRFISDIRIIGDLLIVATLFIVIGTGFAVAGVARRLKEDNRLLQIEINERKRAEETLRESEEKFRQLAENITDVFWMTSPDLQKVLYASPAYEQVWGRSVPSVYAHPNEWADAILPEERERVYATFSRLKTDESSVSVEFPIAHPDGTVRWIFSRGFQVRDAAGQVIRLAGIATDITERKRAEEALRESEERFSGAFEYAPIGVALASPKGRWLKVNRSLCDLIGYSEAELLTRTFQDITYPEDLELSLENVRRMLAGEINFHQMEKHYVHKRGHLVTALLNLSLVRDGQGQPLYFIAQIQDITERKRAEEALRLLGSAVEQSKESIMITNAELDLPGPKILFVNPAFTRMTGFTAEEALGKTPRILQGPRTDKTVLSRLRRNLERGEAFEGEAINYRNDGKEFNLEWQIAPLRNAGGKITHFVAIQHDITARKRLEAQLFQSQKMETVGKLAGGIAHEFNSILTAIIGQSELLLGDLPAGSPQASSADEINKAAGRAAALTRQLLAYGRKQILQPEILDLNSVLAGLENTLRHLMGRDVDVRLAPAAGLKSVKADAGQIEQVIMNMVINAHDAMPNGGKLTLETASVTFDEQSVGRFPELKPGDYVMLAITDTGTGMSAEVKARAFEPFFSTKDVGQGTGLGLSTCYGIVKQSGGHISVYSELARGATFKIYLPQVESRTKNPTPRLDTPDLPRGMETILLVEDDPALREMAATLLRRLGYTVLAAANGIEALSLKQQRDVGHIDLLFTDVVMPHMSGKELAERVRALYPHTRILFTSAYTENAIVHQGVLDQGVALLQKPFTPSALAHKLREVLDEPGVPRPDAGQGTFGFTETPHGVNTP